jgi:predicted esterase YcpF (UPF0227 family)
MTAQRVPITHLLYLHGFRSSPLSIKARIVGGWLAAQRPDVVWHCPQLSPSPAAAVREVLEAIAGWPRATTGIVGSSLGGFYATVLAERLGPTCRAVLLIRPSIRRDLTRHIGEITAWHSDERFHFRAEFIEAAAVAPGDSPHGAIAIVARRRVLDWREMSAHMRVAGQVARRRPRASDFGAATSRMSCASSA